MSEQRLAQIFVEVADTLVDEFDLIEFLQSLADHAAGLVDAATVGLLVADDKNRLRFMAASDETAKGAVAQAHHISVDAAFDVMRAYARQTNRRLSDVAHRVVTDMASLPDLTGS